MITDDQAGANAQTEHLGTWEFTTVGLAARHTGRRFRLTVEHTGVNHGRVYAGVLLSVGPSEYSTIYGALSVQLEDGTGDVFHLPYGHPLEVFVEPIPEPGLPDGVDVDELRAEALRRYETDRLFHNRAHAASLLAEGTDFGGLEGAVLAGAAFALVVHDHPEVTP